MKVNQTTSQQQYFTERKVLKSHYAILLPIYLGHMQKLTIFLFGQCLQVSMKLEAFSQSCLEKTYSSRSL